MSRELAVPGKFGKPGLAPSIHPVHLTRARAAAIEFAAAFVVEKGWLELHESGTYT
ncbi:hypothetical protein [Bradyrhizobium sp. CB2312]|uniref:hypothetical protein n=1 Tax=Bradyrhizobium sp. CB2312 TaxID=3039155 RepID=UPI0024B2666D|nr:hypothetical protein [Bradyrhizobium sp. CB2312]WFU75592.1 hypothetical protein QA642_17160 [Bradyrhizobium sp. CB2312]